MSSIGPGRIYSLQNVDNTAYGSLPANTANQIMKQGILATAVQLSCPPPSTSGFSINYLVEAIYQDSDATPVLLPFFNANNPTVPFQGPNGNGAASNTQRLGLVGLQLKAGAAAPSGTQTTPAPDAGFVGLYGHGGEWSGDHNIRQYLDTSNRSVPLEHVYSHGDRYGRQRD